MLLPVEPTFHVKSCALIYDGNKKLLFVKYKIKSCEESYKMFNFFGDGIRLWQKKEVRLFL